MKNSYKPAILACVALGVTAFAVTLMPNAVQARVAFTELRAPASRAPINLMVTKPTVAQTLGGGAFRPYKVVPGYTVPGYRPFGWSR